MTNHESAITPPNGSAPNHEAGIRPIEMVLNEISGEHILASIIDFARFGGELIEGTPDNPLGYEVTRPTLSPIELESRVYLKELMEGAGTTVEEHPLGLIGTYHGTNPELPAVGLISHFDSIYKAGMFDGVAGIIIYLHILNILHKLGIQFEHDIMLIACTGEESAPFNFPMLGSEGQFLGLSEEKLQAQGPEGVLKDALVNAHFNPADVKNSIFTPEMFDIMIEAHVAQNNRLKSGEIGVVNGIAAPTRHIVTIGDNPLQIEQAFYPAAIYKTLHIHGKAGHSGAMPMDSYRADGLLAVAYLISELSSINSATINGIAIDAQSINKIAGKTTVSVRVDQNDYSTLQEIIQRLNVQLQERFPEFGSEAITIADAQPTAFFPPDEMRPRLVAAADVIKTVNTVATSHNEQHVVGTVTLCSINDKGQVILGTDVRGIDHNRDKAMDEIRRTISQIILDHNVPQPQFSHRLPGSGDPVLTSAELVGEEAQLLEALGIQFKILSSAAGHDIQNAIRAGFIEALLLFCASVNNGAAHTRDEKSLPSDLQLLAQAVVILVMRHAKMVAAA